LGFLKKEELEVMLEFVCKSDLRNSCDPSAQVASCSFEVLGYWPDSFIFPGPFVQRAEIFVAKRVKGVIL
jgi:hypothetical protein